MKVPKSYDVQSKGAIPCEKGTNPFDNPGIKPHESAIKDTPGESATNPAKAFSQNKGQPFGKGGSGYTNSF
jgi:hypothetical protein